MLDLHQKCGYSPGSLSRVFKKPVKTVEYMMSHPPKGKRPKFD